jgi:hypothetical protein
MTHPVVITLTVGDLSANIRRGISNRGIEHVVLDTIQKLVKIMSHAKQLVQLATNLFITYVMDSFPYMNHLCNLARTRILTPLLYGKDGGKVYQQNLLRLIISGKSTGGNVDELLVDVVDAVGLLPLTNAGNRYLLVAIDFLTRWPIAAAVPDITAESTVEFLMNHLVSHHGAPQRIVSDRGSNFTARYTKYFFEKLNTRWKNSTAARPQTNGMVERMNQTLTQTIAKLSLATENTIGQTTEWDRVVNEALMAIRTMPNKTTGYSAARLL